MPKSLFTQLKKLGVDEETACQVSASLDPDYNASKKDVLVMQEAILQVQATCFQQQSKNEESYHALRLEISDTRKEISDTRHELGQEISDTRHGLGQEISVTCHELRHEIHTSINRQYIITFGSLLITIATVLAVNWYFR